MTKFDIVKKDLLKEGFKVVETVTNTDKIFSNGRLFIHISGDGEVLYYHAATRDNIPISWHVSGTETGDPELWVGENYNIEKSGIKDLFNEHLAWILYENDVAHEGHYPVIYNN